MRYVCCLLAVVWVVRGWDTARFGLSTRVPVAEIELQKGRVHWQPDIAEPKHLSERAEERQRL